MSWPEVVFYSILALVGFPFSAWTLICLAILFDGNRIPEGLLPFKRRDR